MTEFEYILTTFLVLAICTFTYTAGKHDLVHLICRMLEEQVRRIGYGGWIPCSVRQPKEPEYGKGSCDSYIVQCQYIYEPFSAYWDGENWSDVDGKILDGIVAWRPLPKPY